MRARELYIALALLLWSASMAFAQHNVGGKWVVDSITYEVTSTAPKKVDVSTAEDIKRGKIAIPERVNQDGQEYTVRGIGKGAFIRKSSLETVSIPNTVKSIGEFAFMYCGGMTTVSLPSSITSIGKRAFSSCGSLSSVSLPSSVTAIGEDAFGSCDKLSAIEVAMGNPKYKSTGGALFSKDGATLVQYPAGKTGDSYAIPSSVTGISTWAFAGCQNLKTIGVPSTVARIGESAFVDCRALSAIDVDPGNASYKSVEGMLFSKDGATLIQYPAKKPGEAYAIPSSVTRIEVGAFAYCGNLTSVTIPNSITSIEGLTFAGASKRESVKIPPHSYENWWFCIHGLQSPDLRDDT